MNLKAFVWISSVAQSTKHDEQQQPWVQVWTDSAWGLEGQKSAALLASLEQLEGVLVVKLEFEEGDRFDRHPTQGLLDMVAAHLDLSSARSSSGTIASAAGRSREGCPSTEKRAY